MNPLSLFSQTQKAFLAIIGLPLLIMLLGFWQLQRVPSSSAIPSEVARLQQTLDALNALQNGQVASAKGMDGQTYSVATAGEEARANELSKRQYGKIVVVKGANGGTYNAGILIAVAQKTKEGLESSAYWNIVAGWLALGAFVLGLAGAATGVLFLGSIHAMGKRALKSRAVLLKSFRSGQKRLPWFLGVVGILFFMAIVSATAYEVLRLALIANPSKDEMRLVFGGGAVVIVCLYMGVQLIWNLIKTSRAAFKLTPLEILGRSISKQEAPQLWGFVHGVAGRVQAKMPDTIVAGLNECFFVTENPVKLSNGAQLPPGRILYLPLPYMAFMSKPEVAAVIGHELAHFTGDDTEYSLRFAPIYSTAVKHLATVHEVGDDTVYWQWMTQPVRMLGAFFLRSFNEAVKYWSRKRELAADAMGARVAGKEAAALALVRLSALAPHVDAALVTCWREGGQAGGVLAETRRLIREKGLDDPRTRLEKQQAHPTDTHPTTQQRLEALGVPVSAGLLSAAQDPRGSTLLQDLGLEGANDASDHLSARQNAPVSAALEAEFSSTAKSDRDDRIATLRELAARGTDSVTLFERGVFICLVAVLAGPALLAIPFLAHDMPVGAKWLFWVMGPFTTVAGASLLLRLRKPFLTLSPDGIMFANLQKPLPWTAIEDIGIGTATANKKSGVFLTLDLAGGFVPPSFAGDRRIKYRPKKQDIIATAMGIKGHDTDAFAKLVLDHWRGGQARAELEKYKSAR